ncbi:PAS domain-containing sensor histidine kinase [Aquihabitans sp. G128]|uniref:sensor histidine kinase n=1 Tax=Aquihabitans sp. G128 TaxID=2849779 RepID=UPI001C22C63E|nr:PAS domain-containing sensor histidine kinase [Aquihabitans sp. G128]QXC61902.1 PAS domain-containing sensor histidine kinase [Aquihabitans sp. G128]
MTTGSTGSGAGTGRIVVDSGGTVLEADDAAAERLGRPAAELAGRSVSDVLGSGADGIAVVAAVGHELRSPLTSIRGYTSLLLNRWEKIGDADKQLMLGQINHDAERVTRLINELLDISRLETGRLTLTPRWVSLPELAQSVVTSIRATSPDLEAEVAVGADVPEVPADSDKIEQVLTNLVENAVKYGSPKGLRIEAELVAGSPGAVAVTVRDAGEGIAPEDLPRVFDRWFQREHGRPNGTGLGLWISRGLVEAHGGQLTVASPPGEGAAFTFTLPLASP